MAIRSARAAPQPIFVSDFDGAVTKKDSNDVLLSRIRNKTSELETVLFSKREDNLRMISQSGLLHYAFAAGWRIKFGAKNGFSKVELSSDHRHGQTKMPMPEIPAPLSNNLEKYYGHAGPSSKEFFSAFLPTDSGISDISSGISEWQELNQKCLPMMLSGKMDMFRFHSILDAVMEGFLVRRDFESAAKEIVGKHVRPGISGLFSAARKLNAIVVFCSYSYTHLLSGVIDEITPKSFKPKSIMLVANSVNFHSKSPDSRVKNVERIGDKWLALDYALHFMGVKKHGGKYFGAAYDDSTYNVPDMVSRFSTPILLVPKEKQGNGGKERLLTAYPSLSILAENSVAGIDQLRVLLLSAFGNSTQKR